MLSAVNTGSFHVQVHSMYFNYDNLEFRYEPYPIGISRPLMKPEVYREFLDNYPKKHWFKYMGKLGHKYSLSEHFDVKKFYRFLRGNPLWNDFNKWIKSRDFVHGVLEVLAERSLALGMTRT